MTRSRWDWHGWVAAGTLLGSCVLVPGCAKSSATSASPGADAAAAEPAESKAERAVGASSTDDALALSQNLDDLEAEYVRVDAALTEAGVTNTLTYAPKADPAGAPAGGEVPKKKVAVDVDAVDRCERICDLQVSICDLSARICTLAESHEGEERYATACSGASARCEQAQGACETCGSD